MYKRIQRKLVQLNNIKEKSITREKRYIFHNYKSSVHQEYITVVNLYASREQGLNYRKQKVNYKEKYANLQKQWEISLYLACRTIKWQRIQKI